MYPVSIWRIQLEGGHVMRQKSGISTVENSHPAVFLSPTNKSGPVSTEDFHRGDKCPINKCMVWSQQASSNLDSNKHRLLAYRVDWNLLE